MEQICTVDISIIDTFSVSLQPRALNPSVCPRFSPPLPLFSSSSTLSSLAREGRDVQFFSRRQERGRTVGERREKIRERRDRDGRRREEREARSNFSKQEDKNVVSVKRRERDEERENGKDSH